LNKLSVSPLQANEQPLAKHVDNKASQPLVSQLLFATEKDNKASLIAAEQQQLATNMNSRTVLPQAEQQLLYIAENSKNLQVATVDNPPETAEGRIGDRLLEADSQQLPRKTR